MKKILIGLLLTNLFVGCIDGEIVEAKKANKKNKKQIEVIKEEKEFKWEDVKIENITIEQKSNNKRCHYISYNNQVYGYNYDITFDVSNDTDYTIKQLEFNVYALNENNERTDYLGDLVPESKIKSGKTKQMGKFTFFIPEYATGIEIEVVCGTHSIFRD